MCQSLASGNALERLGTAEPQLINGLIVVLRSRRHLTGGECLPRKQQLVDCYDSAHESVGVRATAPETSAQKFLKDFTVFPGGQLGLAGETSILAACRWLVSN